MTESVSFDRAADYYDRTRSLTDEQMEVLVSRLLAELPGSGRCLEIGIGTGRIALPLRARRIRMVGIDISVEMLRKLREKDATVPVAIADATRLPFADGTFAAAVAAHVLHLIPGWKTAIDELMRVVVPGGVFLASKGGDLRPEWQARVRSRFFAEAGDPPWPRGIDTMQELDEEMRERGAAVREIRDVRSEGTFSISMLLEAFEKGIYAACWSIDDATRRRAAAATREWAESEFGDLDAPRQSWNSSDWRAYLLVSPIAEGRTRASG
ncbi:MAG TPA: class I SAM-dependent methyltransferase [Candidatus Dormibacteraeota bacterium]|nr:class I SAM-dependent methyltransferase [Candidatus Dormibacteraeota bacterium]